MYRYDRLDRAYELVSVTPAGKPGDSQSHAASVSDDGRHVAFTSASAGFVEGDTNRTADVFVRDLVEGTTLRVSVASDGSQAGRAEVEGHDRWAYGASFDPAISGDGTRVAFVSHAANLVPDDTNDAADAFVRDVAAGTTTRVSVTSSGGQLQPYEYSESGSSFRDGVDDVEISGNGDVVVFQSHADGLVDDDHNANVDIFTHELSTGITERVSEPTGGGDAYGEESIGCGSNGECFGFVRSHSPSISHDGDRVFFMSGAPLLTGVDRDDDGRDQDMFVHDRSTGVTQLVNRRPGGSCARGNNEHSGTISSDGGWVSYSSDARGIAPGDRKAGADVFLQGLDDAAFGD